VSGGDPAKYSLAYSRLGRQPMIYSESPEQSMQMTGPAWGRTYQPPQGAMERTVSGGYMALNPTFGPLAEPVHEQLSKGGPVSVIMPYREDTPPGVPLHEATHAFQGTDALPLSVLYTKVEPSIRGRISDALTKQGVDPDTFSREIPARLASGQFKTLGLTPEEGRQLWQTYLDMYQKMAPEKANRLRLYTKGRTGNVDPSLSTSTPPPEPQAK